MNFRTVFAGFLLVGLIATGIYVIDQVLENEAKEDLKLHEEKVAAIVNLQKIGAAEMEEIESGMCLDVEKAISVMGYAWPLLMEKDYAIHLIKLRLAVKRLYEQGFVIQKKGGNKMNLDEKGNWIGEDKDENFITVIAEDWVEGREELNVVMDFVNKFFDVGWSEDGNIYKFPDFDTIEKLREYEKVKEFVVWLYGQNYKRDQ